MKKLIFTLIFTLSTFAIAQNWPPSGGGGGGASTSLNNLTSPTAINQSLLPASNNSLNLGASSSNEWQSVFAGTSYDLGGGASFWNLSTASTNWGSSIPSFLVNSTFFPGTSGTAVWFGSNDDSTDVGSTPIFLASGDNTAVGSANVTGGIHIESGNVDDGTSTARTGTIAIASGNSSGSGQSGLVVINTGTTTTPASGVIQLATGTSSAGNSGAVQISSGTTAGTSKSTGAIQISSGNAGGTTSNSGAISITTGSATGTRGNITLNAPTTTINGNLATTTMNGNLLFTPNQTQQIGDDTHMPVFVETVQVKSHYYDSLSNSALEMRGVDPNHGILIYTLDQTGNSQPISIFTGASSGGSRGTISLDAPTVNFAHDIDVTGNILSGGGNFGTSGAAFPQGWVADVESNGILSLNTGQGRVKLLVWGSGNTPPCASGADDGVVAITHAHIMCVCNGTSFVQVSDGSTACTF
jgi:hypothetical protein